ncbi:MAG TPA: hypothetical protein VK832_15200, partial [Burkholderiaceae bacterium]|nr:hypothetical protein [Burkholderiaceae bacterium]
MVGQEHLMNRNPRSWVEKKLMTVLITVLLTLAGILPLRASIMPVNLQCEYRFNPLGIDVAQPRVVWQVQSDERGQAQTAYQILVASSKKLLENNQGD